MSESDKRSEPSKESKDAKMPAAVDTCKRKRFLVELLHCRGDDDYGALHIEQEYGFEVARKRCKANGGSASFGERQSSMPIDVEQDEDDGNCHAQLHTFEFSNANDRNTALEMADFI